MIIAISVAATLTGIAISVLLVMFRSEQHGRSHLADAESLTRLADQFRQDVHTAVADTVGDKKNLHDWQFDLGAKQIARYTFANDVISREQRTDAKPLRREAYRLPKDSAVAISVDRNASPPIVSLTIEPRDTSLPPAHPFRVDAVLGRDLRFTERHKEGK
jgi:type II secretory pathway component PulJ